MSTNQCDSCVHKQICDLWSRQECQNAASYSSMDRDECDYYVEARRWIPVEERLPEKDVRVLVRLADDSRLYTKIDTDRIHYDNWVRWGTYVTHWMPLPAPIGE